MAPSAPALVPSDIYPCFRADAAFALTDAEVPPMPEARFWALVERLGWTDAAVNREARAQALARELDLHEVLAANATYARLCSKLFDRVDACGDPERWRNPTLYTRLWAMFDHVIGCGRAEYERVVADPAPELERASRGDFPEGVSVFSRAIQAYSDEVLGEALRQLCSPKPFAPDALVEDAVVEHPLFGMGVVADVSDGRAQVVFPGGDLFVETGAPSKDEVSVGTERPAPEEQVLSDDGAREHSPEPEDAPSSPEGPRDFSTARWASGLVPPRQDRGLRHLAGRALHRAAPAMPEERFWALVERIGWADASVDAHARAQALAGELDLLEVFAASSSLYGLKWRLQTRLEEWEKASDNQIPCGDDGFSDLCHHIIGLGRAEYERVWEDPALALERAERSEFRESFAYVFQLAKEAYPDAAYAEALRRSASPQPFDPARLEEAAVVEHPRFGVGVVSLGRAARVVFAGGELVAEG